MANLGNYDATGGQTMDERSALPAGEYIAALVKSDKKDTKNGRGAYINCEFEVQDGEAKGRRFWTLLNLWNDNAQAVEIAQRELNSIMHACGRLRVNDTEELHGIPMRVKLKVKTDSYGEKNEVASYQPLNGAPVGQSSQAASPGAGTANAPWKRAAG
ncbi:MAG: DUF669 domain-containing protein [Hyphomonas sp.]|jgi:hypothetical protein|nr:DUF669 domain-containing protein [Hyphomonas sp.]